MDEYRCKGLPDYEIVRRNEQGIHSEEYGIPLHLPVPMPYQRGPEGDSTPTDKEGGTVIIIGDESIDGVVIIDLNNL
tara:strand:- start:133 stop:363 length:231 start_codon:yes stop_codon:yes gene_type:complete